MRFLLLLFIFSLSSSLAFAEDSGRLRDGRAYRTDESGYRLIDQLAEYEVKIGELKSQVILLEDELVEKNREIVSFRNNTKAASKIAFREKDLLKEENAKSLPPQVIVKEKIVFKDKIVQKECAVQKCEIPKLVYPVPSCTENEILSLKSELDRASLEKAELARARDKNLETLARLKSEKEQSELSAKSEMKAREDELVALNLLLDQTKRRLSEGERELASVSEDLIKEKAERAKASDLYAGIAALEEGRKGELQEVKDQLARSDEKLKNKNFELSNATQAQAKEVKDFKNSLARKEQELKLTQEKLTQLDEQIKTTSYARAKLAPVVVATPLAVRIVKQDPFSQSKQVLQAKLSLIEQKIRERKEISDALKAKPSYVQINSSPLNTSRGISLEILRARSERLVSEKQAERVLFGLKEIESVLDEDIGLLRRIGDLQ